MSPSGKAPGFGPGIREFESLHPSQEKSGRYDRFFLGLRCSDSARECHAFGSEKVRWTFARELFRVGLVRRMKFWVK